VCVYGVCGSICCVCLVCVLCAFLCLVCLCIGNGVCLCVWVGGYNLCACFVTLFLVLGVCTVCGICVKVWCFFLLFYVDCFCI